MAVGFEHELLNASRKLSGDYRGQRINRMALAWRSVFVEPELTAKQLGLPERFNLVEII
jgi:hypothetical protein